MPDKNYVIKGQWADQEWHDLASNYKYKLNATNEVSAETNARYWAGPRIHPYGPLAFEVIVKGEPRVYPTKEAAEADGVTLQDAPEEN